MEKAYHRLILPDGSVKPMAVVRTDEAGRLEGWHTLTREEPFVEWVGGTLDLRPPTLRPSAPQTPHQTAVSPACDRRKARN